MSTVFIPIFVAAASLFVAALGFGAATWLEVFAPCRVLYRVQPTVQGSLACQTYAALNLASLLLALAALVLVLVAAVRAFGRRGVAAAKRRGED